MSWTHRDDIVEACLLNLNVGRCEGPCEQEEVPRVYCASRRADSDQGFTLCAWCATEYEDYWDEMWADYWGSRL